jgi:hypothetical protein
MSNKLVAAALVATVTLMFARPAEAVTVFRAIISNEAEVVSPPVPNQTPETGGMGEFILNDAGTALSYDITLFGLDIDGLQTPTNVNDDAARFHIHANTNLSVPPEGGNGGIVFGMKDPNSDLDDLVINPTTGRITGVWDGTEGNGAANTLASNLALLMQNRLYFNVHTPDFPGGEVRGQIVLVPEPVTGVLCALGIAVLCATRRRK